MINVLLDKSTNIKFFDDSISITKGIFNYYKIIINKKDLKEELFLELTDKLKRLSYGESVTIREQEDENPIDSFLKRLREYSLAFSLQEPFVPELVLTDFKQKEVLLDKFQFLENDNSKILDLDEFMFDNNECKNLLVLLDSFSIQKLKQINEYCFKNNIRWLLGFKDGDYLHALYIDKNFTGCFNCFYERIVSRIEDKENLRNFDQLEEKTNFEECVSDFNLLSSLINNLIIRSREYNALLIESKVLSIYLPTFEFHVDKLLKISFCETCGFISRQQSKEMNINMKRAIEEIINEK